MARPWTEGEDALLRARIGTAALAVIAQELGRTRRSVEKRAWNLGLSGEAYGPWTEQELSLLRERYASTPTPELSSLLGKTGQAIATKASQLGLRKLCRLKQGKKAWTPEADSLLRECAGTMSAGDAAQRLGRTVYSVLSRACRLGVRFAGPKSQFERAWPPEKEALLRAGAEAGKSLALMAQEVGRTAPAVLRALRRLGIKRAPLKESRPHGRPKGSGAGRSSAVAPEGWLTLMDAAGMAPCSRQTLLRMLRSGRIEGRRDARGRWIASRESVLAYVREARMRAEGPEMPEKAPERPQEAKAKASASNHGGKPSRAPRRPPEARSGDAPADAGQKLEEMSKLDVLKALASGQELPLPRP